MDSLSSVLIFHKDNENRKLDNFRQKKIEGLGEYFGAYYIHNTFTQSTKSLIKEHSNVRSCCKLSCWHHNKDGFQCQQPTL